jgi:acyl-CoA thioester hydrolase
VNNARYFTWFETARIELFRRVGLARTAGHALSPILARATCDFLRPVLWPAEVEVRVTVPRVGRTSFTTVYEAVQVDLPEPVVVARGEGVIVLVDAHGRPTPVPEDLKAAMLALAGIEASE